MVLYGYPVVVIVLAIGALGLPFLPTNLMLIAAGSLAHQGEMNLTLLWFLAMIGAMGGNLGGYALGRRGGPPVVEAITRRWGGADKIARAELYTRSHGGIAVFLSRWLVAALGPWINLTCGLSGYPLTAFLLWATCGQAIWVSLYLGLGYAFSDHMQEVGDIISDLGATLASIAALALLLWLLLRGRKKIPD